MAESFLLGKVFGIVTLKKRASILQGDDVSRKIPIPVAAVVSNVVGDSFTHTEIDNLLGLVGIEILTVTSNKIHKVRTGLNIVNETKPDPLATLGKFIEEFMEVELRNYRTVDDLEIQREKISQKLSEQNLCYVKGGYITAIGGTVVSRTLQDIIRARDFSGVQTEFDRIYENVQSDPASAVTASCALLESVFKIYIETEKLAMPSEQSIKPLWKVIRADLKFDPAATQDDDLRTILTGLANIVEGTGSLRTHKGSAHGRGKTTYKLKPRHARLAAHAACTLANFVLEAWDERGTAG